MRLLTLSCSSKFLLLLSLVFPLSTCAAYAQGSGTLTGRLQEAKTGETLAGANIVILNTSMGTAADIEGRYTLLGVPVGKWTVRASMIGYTSSTREITMAADSTVVVNFHLSVQTIEGNEVVVTAQARGQQTAIAAQLSSQNIVNVVSSARIQELPDANAAESVGRLPGISLVRSGGEATQVVVRGLAPQYNSITVDGVALPSTNANDRGTDLSMISSNSLEGIEVFKTMTADMDAAVLGGTVNFDIRHAKSTGGATSVSLLAQGAYNDLMSTYNDYKFVASLEKRFFDDRLGVFVQGIAQKQNLTSDQLGDFYYNNPGSLNPEKVYTGYLNLAFSPVDQRRYDGTVTLDYQIPDGELVLLNLFSHGSSTNESHSEQYDLQGYGDDILFGTSLATNKLNVISNILDYTQTLGSIKVNVKLSNAYADNSTPSGWYVAFDQASSGTHLIDNSLDPVIIASKGQTLVNLSNMKWTTNSAWSSFNKQDDKQATIDLEKNFNLSDLLSVTVKAGGAYKYTTRYYDYDYATGGLNSGAASAGFRQSLVQALPWLANAPYNFDPTGNTAFPIQGFYDSGMKFGKFLKGDYGMLSAVNADALDRIIQTMKVIGSSVTQSVTVQDFRPDDYQTTANDYSGFEFRSAEYLMATLNIGPSVTVIPGVRYQGLKTSYSAAQFIGNADAINPYPRALDYTMVSQGEYHGYWLPDVTVKYDPLTWLTLRASYTSTLAYPDYNTIIPREDVASNTGGWAVWNNYALKPARSQNYDFQIAIHENTIGLFTISPFFKRIDDQIFSQSVHITDPSRYPGLPSYAKGYTLTTFINNSNRVEVRGIEAEWQTHFWYLPDPLSGLVLNLNYTHIFSDAKYPITLKYDTGFPLFRSYFVDSVYADRLLQQPNDIFNLSLGYDYSRFSVLVSAIYQSQVYNGTNFFNALRSDKTNYLRWDLSVKQGLPWNGFAVYFDLNNLNSEADIYTVRGSGFPINESNYGLTADLGVRWTPE